MGCFETLSYTPSNDGKEVHICVHLMVLSLQKGCAENIGWYQSVKETQGSVEKSSFGQMKNIKEYGCYTIGSRASGLHSKLSELIYMDLEQRDKPLPQLKYSLDELRDLESKLVLITGRESEEKEQVDHFLNVSKDRVLLG